MSSEGRRRVVIAGGTGPLGTALAHRLQSTASVRSIGTRAGTTAAEWRANLLSIAETEVALAGAETVIFLARTTGPRARLVQGAKADLDVIMADSVARAAKWVKPKRLVAFFADEAPEGARVLAASQAPLALLFGGGDDPLASLEKLALGDGAAEPLRLPLWKGAATREGEQWTGPSTVLSVQRLPVKKGLTAAQHARAYFEWLPSGAAGTRTTLGSEAFEVRAAGTSLLRLRRAVGQCRDDVEVLEVLDGALVGDGSRGVFEFRLIDGQLFTTLRDFVPAMPWLAYRASQAPMHARTMRLFGAWLAS